MRTVCLTFLSLAFLASSASRSFAQAGPETPTQQTPPRQTPVQPTASSQPKDKDTSQKPEVRVVKPALAFGLEDGTTVKLRLSRELSSAEAVKGNRTEFEVVDDVKVKDAIVIPRGSVALAIITEAQHKRRMGRAGKLQVNIEDVRLADGERAPLRAAKEARGNSHTGRMTGAMVATGIVFFPAAPLFLFMHGKDITIPKGTEITAYINGDIPLDAAKFESPHP